MQRKKLRRVLASAVAVVAFAGTGVAASPASAATCSLAGNYTLTLAGYSSQRIAVQGHQVRTPGATGSVQYSWYNNQMSMSLGSFQFDGFVYHPCNSAAGVAWDRSGSTRQFTIAR